MSPEYRKIKAEILTTVELIRAAEPEAAAYLEETPGARRRKGDVHVHGR